MVKVHTGHVDESLVAKMLLLEEALLTGQKALAVIIAREISAPS